MPKIARLAYAMNQEHYGLSFKGFGTTVTGFLKPQMAVAYVLCYGSELSRLKSILLIFQSCFSPISVQNIQQSTGETTIPRFRCKCPQESRSRNVGVGTLVSRRSSFLPVQDCQGREDFREFPAHPFMLQMECLSIGKWWVCPLGHVHGNNVLSSLV